MDDNENIQNGGDVDGPVGLDGPMTLKDVFEKHLTIPNYQRGYCWGGAQVKGLLESLWTAAKDRPYHLGTLVIHQHSNEKGEVQCDIVDGQQRLITLALLIQELLFSDNGVFPFLSHNTTSDSDVKAHLQSNYATIKEWVSCHPMDFREWLYPDCSGEGNNHVCVSVLRITEKSPDDDTLSLAWTFFDAFNSVGKRLSDYDLLKAHHLRYLSKGDDSEEKESLILNKAAIWDNLGQETVDSFGGKAMFTQTLGQALYLARTWIRNREVQVGGLPADGRYEVLKQYSALTGFASADMPMVGVQAGVVGGKSFFDWTERCVSRYRSFISHPAVRCFQEMPWKDAQIHLLIIARATWFFYYCKFGDVYMPDAISFILYRLGKLRNERCQRKKWYNDDLVKHTIEAIDESPTPEYFFHYCQMPSNRYTRHYNLKNADDNRELTMSGRHGPDFWRKLLALVSSSNLDGLGKSICFKRKIKMLFDDVAKDFGMYLNDDLALSKEKQEG